MGSRKEADLDVCSVFCDKKGKRIGEAFCRVANSITHQATSGGLPNANGQLSPLCPAEQDAYIRSETERLITKEEPCKRPGLIAQAIENAYAKQPMPRAVFENLQVLWQKTGDVYTASASPPNTPAA